MPSFLLIDDEDIVALAFREYLERGGVDVDSARDLSTARRRLAERPYSTVWVDLQLTGVPTADCLRFLSEARESAPAATIIAVSGYASPRMEEQAEQAGANRFLSKPFDARSVAAAMLGS
jgi:DNA-binding NtrC family response regulator